MKKLALLCLILFIFIPLVSAQENTENSDFPGLAPADAPQQGYLVASGLGQNMVPIVNDTVTLLKDLLVVLNASQIAKDNVALIQRAEDLIKRAEGAMDAYRGAISNPLQ